MRIIIQAPKSIIVLSDNPDAHNVFLANFSYQKCTSQFPYQPTHPRVGKEGMAKWYMLESALPWVDWESLFAEHFPLALIFLPFPSLLSLQLNFV